MRELIKICLLASLTLVLCLNGAMGQFGSKVASGDSDVGRFLEDFPAPFNPTLGYWDIGPNPGMYDDGDIVYLDLLGNKIIGANDIRLTAYESNPPGSKVTASDNDINKPLSLLPGASAGIYYADLYGSQGYDFQDPIYVLTTAPTVLGARTSTNDVRLNQIYGLAPGTKVLDYHPDNDGPAVPMIVPISAGTPIATIRFYNTNGNVNGGGKPIYDYADDVYIDVSLSSASGYPFGFVVPNDIRLTTSPLRSCTLTR